MELVTESFHPFRFQALQVDIELLLRCEDKDALIIEKLAVDWFRSAEKRFNRSLAESEINLLNTLAGEKCKVSNTMLEVLHLVEAYHTITAGGFLPHPSETQTWQVDPIQKSVMIPEHGTIDLGGIERSWSVKKLCDYMQRGMELKQGLILAGGNITVWGRTLRNLDPWIIGIQNPWNHAKVGAVALPQGSLSTCSKYEDPSTKGSDVEQCTVVGEDIIECQVWAKALCALGLDVGIELLSKRATRCEAVLIGTNKEVHYIGSKDSLNRTWLDMTIDHYHFNREAS
ncbi:FAD:protein FMN transferase [Paenibacillus hexagrammi]|uniref:FAD:protein FMN transferase n=1 Tax=Paenibacillus hexagrammi TaxID=2908839 RepID=A0ABY3SFR4_9BACL|nr:FAD:protein FMN transferase [Paenibacillus sp. YPD9-1]UJF32868.1 FAD:protein FMN transferase [Paenibacillus sp. YPD9-1]